MKKLITIVGPTAVGKTDLTLALAKGYNGEVISGDAYQVYKHLNIGTAKPTTDELAAVPHHLINILEPDDDYSVSIFQQQAKSLIDQLNDNHVVPILSGGTGLYVQSLLENYNFNDLKPNTELRSELDELYAEYGIDGLRQHAQNLAEKGGIEIKYTDKHRLYRAIELMTAGDFDALTTQTKDGLSYEGPVIGLQRERSDLYDRINRRVEIMFEKGLVDEVNQLLKNGVNPNCQAFKGIGYKEVVQYLEGFISYDACVDLIQKNTRHFAKRQITWYKRMPYIEWITIDSQTTEAEIYGMACNIIDSSF
ncbi:tRNA (adenosine(37)-N6)-dimethylallyltransferase MiaA [uncultured Veillonella sp.]|uniref:tRNA (adenosine(37)-N6)-dimethylallyltransferase MiaA n=1 Tax=uncultured Veillonella sp. TaxID=159268 RepID=UPI00265EAD8B|nr:tRNA (adenosine(37)-N6)-dimethylallyltransferase MiaA [uncultured Veillonella sp.]